MVLRKTEYRLQYSAVTNELRKQIWLENITARGLLRSTNQADHYWAHQLIEDELEEDAATETDRIPPSSRYTQTGADITKYKQRNGNNVLSDIANPLQHEHDLQSVIGREVAAQTPNWEEEFPQQLYDSSQELQHLANNLSLTSVYGDDQLDKCTPPVRPPTPIPPHSPVAPLTVADLIHNQHAASHAGTHAAQVSDGSKYSLHRQMLTRTSRNNYLQHKPSPFESFGWNDLKKNVGEKKTYNVHAPKKEVNEHALEICNRRRQDIERYLAEEAEKKRKALQANSVKSNHSSIWMTEYEANFSNKRKNKVVFNEKLVRPRTAPSVHRPVWWRGAV